MIPERQEAINRLFSFRIKPLEYQGQVINTLIKDEEMESILRFRGTGPIMPFMEVVKAVWEINLKILELQMNGEDTEPCMSHLEYITTHNLQVSYKIDDVTVRKSKCV